MTAPLAVEHGRLVQRGSALKHLASLARLRSPAVSTAQRRHGTAVSPKILSAVFALATHPTAVNRLMAPLVEGSVARFSQSMPGSSGSSLAYTVYGSFRFRLQVASYLFHQLLGVLSERVALFCLHVGPWLFLQPFSAQVNARLLATSLSQFHGRFVRFCFQLDARIFLRAP